MKYRNTFSVVAVGVFKIILCYFALWVISYSIVMYFDYDYFVEYFYLSWSSPGETPAFIQLIS